MVMSPGYQAATAAEPAAMPPRRSDFAHSAVLAFVDTAGGGWDRFQPGSQTRHRLLRQRQFDRRTTVGTSQYHRVDRQQVRFGAGHRAPLAEAQSISAEHPRRYRQRR